MPPPSCVVGGGLDKEVPSRYEIRVTRAERIEQKLRAALTPMVLEVLNESDQHSVPRGSETHFKVVVVSAAFDGKSAVARHQMVYGALAEELQTGIHALAITSRTPGEWEASSAIPASPPCLGGSKADAKPA
jgi:stress-induced morphogen